MSAKRRCGECEHRPRRVVSSTMKTARGPEGGAGRMAEPRQHKRPCHCECHGDAS